VAVPTEFTAGSETDPGDRSWIWPAAIIAGLALMIAVNAAFIIVAVRGADTVVESYQTEPR